MGLETGEKEVYSILAVYCIGFYMGYMGLLMSVSVSVSERTLNHVVKFSVAKYAH